MQALLKGRKPVVLVEELSYPGFRRAADLVRADVVPVAMDAHGVIPEALARAAAQHDAQIFCTSPEVHNPTCLFTPLQRRLELVEVARAHDLQVIDDDCYQIAAAKAPSYRKLAPERGWYVSSISKSLTLSLAGGDGHCPAWTCGPAAPCGGTCVLWLADTDPGPDGGLADPSAIARSDRTGTGRYQPVCAGGGEHSGPLRPALERKRALCLAAAARRLARHRICQAAEAQGVQVRAGEEFACRDARSPMRCALPSMQVCGWRPSGTPRDVCACCWTIRPSKSTSELWGIIIPYL